MERIPLSPPLIPPLPAGEQRPLWSVMIPVYNCAAYIPEVLESVLVQDMGQAQMQIEVVDDASSDADVEAIVRRIGKGRILYYRQPQNTGSLRNFETCIKRSKGKLVHLLHGDDRVRQGFYKKMTSLFELYPQAGAAFCRYGFINETGRCYHINPLEARKDGILKGWFLRIASRQRIQYVAMVVRREVYERLGSFYGMPYGEDWEMWVRISRYFPVAYTPEILADYRMCANSISHRMGNTGLSLFYLLKSHAIIKEHIMQENLPAEISKKVISNGKKHCALYCIGLANAIYKQTRNSILALKYIIAALNLSKKPIVFYRVLKFLTKTFLFHIDLSLTPKSEQVKLV